jgi:hypothetical protein
MSSSRRTPRDPLQILLELRLVLQRLDRVELSLQSLVVEERVDHAVAIQANRLCFSPATALGHEVMIGHDGHLALAQRAYFRRRF